jgi:hypothetical protein
MTIIPLLLIVIPFFMNLIPAQAGIPSGLFDAFCFQIFAKHFASWVKFYQSADSCLRRNDEPGDRFYAE